MTAPTQGTIDDLLSPAVAHARHGDPETSLIAAGRVDVKDKQRLALRALLDLKRHNPAPVEAWKVSGKALLIQRHERPQARPLGESTIRTRLNELTRLGLVEVVDHEGRTEAGGRCSRYLLTPAGVSEARELG